MNYLTSNIDNNDIKSVEYNLIKKGLKEFYNIDSFNLLYTKNGKPYLDNNIYISISNSRNLVVVAFSDKLIGVDLEYYKKVSNSLKRYLKLNKNIDDKTTIIEFCKKEAIIKLEDNKLIDIRDKEYNYDNYQFNVIKNSDYVIVIVTKV